MLSPPLCDEIEVTLMGPGYGESIVIHIGNNKWIIIDSCINSKSKICAPLEYLKNLGVSPENIVLIIATHWHDDHVKGLSDLVQESNNAKFCCSVALTKDEFLANVARFEENNFSRWTSGVTEFNKILTLFEQNKTTVPIRATCNRRVYQTKPDDNIQCQVWSLSPSDKEVELFLKEISNIIPIEGDPPKRMHVTRNNISLVIQILINDEIILLGSDLEETKDKYTGWSVIVESEEKPTGKAKIFKIPHHGSINGHSDDVWNYMVDRASYSILTPYNRGRKKLPSMPDINRIVSYSDNSFSTVGKFSRKTKKRSSTVEKIIKETVGKLRNIDTDVGIIRLRKVANNDSSYWQTELFNGACYLKDFKIE